MLRISVIICTYNRAELLRDCLQSLADQTIYEGSYEVLVVDNNSSDDTPLIINEFVRQYDNFRGVVESQQGLSHARNRGCREAQADWVSYVDDDAKAYPNYVERALQTIDQFNFDAFGGVYLPWYKYGRPAWFPDAYGTNQRGKPEKVGEYEGFLSGGVIVFKKSVLEKMGGFDPSVGMSGDKIAYGEETLLQIRMREQGYRLGFDPELKIDHLVNTYKLTRRWMLQADFAKGRDYWHAFDQKLSPITFLRVSLKPFLISFQQIPRLFSGKINFSAWSFGLARNFSFTFGMIRGGIRKLFS